MGKEGELWDDSALVKAFDDAMFKYRVQAFNFLEAEDTNNIVSNTKTETGESENHVPVKEDPCVDSPEPYIYSSNGLATQDAVKGYSCSQSAEDYNQLFSQYFELEEQKQQILQQLHQFSSWNYQFSGEGSSSGALTTQEHTVPASQESNSSVVCSCCLYGCQFLVAPSMTYPACSLGGTCTDKTCTDTSAAVISQKPHSLVHSNAEKAMSSLQTKISVNPDINEEVEEKKENESNSSETDLTVVLNAWYSAGFYTGKYLTEQFMAKNHHG